MDKSEKMKMATKTNRKKTFWGWVKDIILFPWRVLKAIWRFLVRVWLAIWNWLKDISLFGMINLTLLVAIIVLCSSLISFVWGDKTVPGDTKNGNVEITSDSYVPGNNVVQRRFNTNLPMRTDSETGITPKVKVVGMKKPVVDKNLSLPAEELPKQNLYGDVIVDTYPNSVVLMNGVVVNGNLYVQNMHKYTLPCGAKISGNLFIRNVGKLHFCGSFSVKGNIYVTHHSSFGPIPQDSYVGGQVVL